MTRACIPAQTCAPTGLQRVLAYVATGTLPPLPRLYPLAIDAVLSFSISTAACLGLGVLIGQEIAR